MQFPLLIEARLVKRYKRFLADFELESGEIVTAHCANPGSMKSIVDAEAVARGEVWGWLSVARPGRKLGYTWEVALLGKAEKRVKAYVNPVAANRVVLEALENEAISELVGYDVILSEQKYGTSSRIDFLLSGAPGRAYVEVKNVTLSLGEGRAAFPDSVSARGTKHLQELMQVAKQGHRAVLLFCLARDDAKSVEAAAAIDPLYAKTLKQAAQSGVEVLAYTGPLSRQGFRLERPVRVIV